MNIILPQPAADLIEAQLREHAPDATIVHIDGDGAPDDDLSQAEVLIRWWTSQAALSKVLEAAPRLRWIHTPSAGVDHIITSDLRERNITLTNSAGAHAIPIAEFVLMFMLNHAKQAQTLLVLTPENAWERGRDLQLQELSDKTLLIIGLGHIGEEIARRASAFGMRVLGSRRRPRPSPGVAHVVGEDGWRDLLPEADYIAIATPLTDQTRGMVDAAAFARMRPGAYLINIARGQIIHTDALLAALHDGRIGGAALDALPEEPLPPEHPLWQAPNVWITPHISWSSPHFRRRAIEIFFENLRRYRSGEPLVNQVDLEAGY